MVWRIWKQKHKKVRIPKMHCSLFMLQDDWNIEHSLSIHLFYGRFYFLTLSYQMEKMYSLTESSSWKMLVRFYLLTLSYQVEKMYSLTESSSWKIQVCLSLYGVLVG